MKLQPVKLGKRCAVAIMLNIALSLALAASLQTGQILAGQIVDRVVANVNGHVVLQSDWEQEVAFEEFSNARDPNSFTAVERNQALDQLIDRELLREQVHPSQPAPAEQVAARLAELRQEVCKEAAKLQKDCATGDGWRVTLQRYGLTQSSLEKRLSDEIQLMKLVDDRLRPSIHIDPQAVETYYNDRLLPEMQRAGSRVTPLPEVSGRIEDLLAEQKMNELLSGWLASLRSGSRIWTPGPAAGDRNP
jgi:hypothetical protein